MNASEHSETRELGKTYEFAELEQRWLARWLADKTFSARMDAGKPAFSIVIPPPNVTGVLHIGHALNNTLQDILVRYHRMLGDNTLWVPGTDHAGIATQNVVERQLAREGSSRHKLGREAFVERVWQWRAEKGGAIFNQLRHLGLSCDWDRERFTMDEGLSRAVREVFVRLYQEGLIYKGPYIVNWCPRCHTALADDEVEHEDQDGMLYHVHYPLADGSRGVIIATTRPETMLGDTAVAVHPEDERYRRLPADTTFLLPLSGRTIPLIRDSYVEREFGTGALKVTPAHDRNDYELGQRHDLEQVVVFDDNGIMNEQAGSYQGLDRFACRRRIVADLKEQGFLVREEPYRHAVGCCYRCHTVVEPYISDQWFVSVRPLADKAVEAVKSGRIKIHPDIWDRTFYSWMANIRDWCISRQIWWGHRIPAWNCADCGKITVSTAEPSVCAHCGGGNIKQEEDVLDTWFSSALWPFTTMGWPEKTRELAMFYPTSVLSTGFDILFFWVARMMMMGLHIMNEVPFRDVYLHALVRDRFGKKMSKSTGNVIDPMDMIAQYGADALRFTLTAFAAQGREIRMDTERIEGYRRFINKLWNAARFAVMHLHQEPDLQAFQPGERPEGLVHRWMLHRLNATVGEVRRALDSYNFNDAASLCYQFVWHHFCDWYLEWIKKDLFKTDSDEAHEARRTLLTVFEATLKLLHPIIPFVTEEIWSHLPGRRGYLMLAPFPEAVPSWNDDAGNGAMSLLMDVISGLRSIRTTAELHPGAQIKATLICPNAERRQLLERYRADIMTMAKAEELAIVAAGAVPNDAGHALVGDVELVVPLRDLLDVAGELEKLTRERARLEAELSRIQGKLDNPNFTAKAPEAVVAREREKAVELSARLQKNSESINRMRALQ